MPPHIVRVDSPGVPRTPAAGGPAIRWRRWAAIGLGLLAAGIAAAIIVPCLRKPAPITAVFTVPRLFLRAAGNGEIGTVSVKVGQAVQPDTDLLTIRPDPAPTPTTLALRAQWNTMRARAATLDAAIAQPPADAGGPVRSG